MHPIHVATEHLERIEAFYNEGRMDLAWELAQRMGPLAQWDGREARQMAARVAGQLGGAKLSHILFHRNHRAFPGDADTTAYAASSMGSRRGPLAMWRFLQRVPEPAADTPPAARIHLLTTRISAAMFFRDFETAHRHVEAARAINAADRWLAVVESDLLEAEDRYEEALEVARRSLTPHPHYRPGVLQVSHLLRILDRDEEALAFLRAAHAGTRHTAIACALASLEMELDLHADARAHWEDAQALMPLAPKKALEAVQRNRLRCLCREGRLEEAAALAREIDGPREQELLERLAHPEAHRARVDLPVRFVRQHHMTCAPATLTALAKYWGRDVRHLEVVERICHDGTPAHSQRRWAEETGFVTQEFTVTWEAVRALTDRAVPFTLATSEINTGHLQAVIGYDELNRSILIRDPFVYGTTEGLCPAFFEHYAATGPRGLLLLPAGEAGRLDGLDLPDQAVYDLYHALNLALDRHDRAAAGEILTRMEAEHPGHRVTLTALRALAGYDHNGAAMRRAVDELQSLHPKDTNLLLTRLSLLGENGTVAERLALLEEQVARPDGDSLFRVRLAGELRADARHHARAFALAESGVRRRPGDAEALLMLAHHHWDIRRFDEALDLYRLAACLAELRENFVWPYVIAANARGRGEEALAFLRRRVERHGRRSGEPAMTLARALDQAERIEEGFTAVDHGIRLRPEDGDLRLFAAEMHGRYGKMDQAREHAAAAEGRAHRAEWLRACARLAAYAGNPAEALTRWRELLTLDPSALDARREAHFLTRSVQGDEEGFALLHEGAALFPRNVALLRLRAELVGEWNAQAGLEAVDQLLALEPGDAWARRERAVNLVRLGRNDEARAEAERAVEIDPNSDASLNILADVHRRGGRPAEAREVLRRAVEANPDNEFALRLLLNCTTRVEDKREDLLHAAAALERQRTSGDGLLALQRAAKGILSPAETLERLREAHRVRPDLWAAWSALVAQLGEMGSFEEALPLAREATESFPLTPRLWLDLARLHHLRHEPEPADKAARRALAINPGYTEAAQFLSEQLLNQERYAEALQVMEAASARIPLQPFNHGVVADLLWRLGRREEALERLRHALRLEPGYDWGWSALATWADELGRPALPREEAEALVARRPGEARSWLRLAMIQAGEDPVRAHDTANEALARNPACEDAVDLQARLWLRRGEPDRARQTCLWPSADNRAPGLWLREAWIEHTLGRRDAALEALRACLAAHPLEQRGWIMVAEYAAQSELYPEAEAACERLAVLAPLDAGHHALRGDIALARQDARGAIAAYRRTMELDPARGNTGVRLLDLLLEHGTADEAAGAITLVRPHVPAEVVDQAEVRLHARRKDWDDAVAVFQRMCGYRISQPWAMEAAANALLEGSLLTRVREELEAAVQRQSPNQWLGYFWLAAKDRGRLVIPAEFSPFLESPVQWENGVGGYLDLIAGRDVLDPEAQFGFVLEKYSEKLRATDFLWGKVGYVHCVWGQDAELLEWGGDWRERRGVEPWMLQNLALAHDKMGKGKEALEITNAALRHPMEAAARHEWQAFAALREWLDGTPENAIKRMAEVSREKVEHQGMQETVYRLASALRHAHDGRPDADVLHELRVICNRGGSSGRTAAYYDRTVSMLTSRFGRKIPRKLRKIIPMESDLTPQQALWRDFKRLLLFMIAILVAMILFAYFAP